MNDNTLVTLQAQEVAEELIKALVYNKEDLVDFLVVLIKKNDLDVDLSACRRTAQHRQLEILKAA